VIAECRLPIAACRSSFEGDNMRRMAIPTLLAAIFTAAAHAQAPARLTHEGLYDLLGKAGYKLDRTPDFYRIDFAKGDWKYFLNVLLSPDGSRVTISIPLHRMPAGRVDPTHLLKLLAENERVIPASFQYSEKNNLFYLTLARESAGLDAERLGRDIETTRGHFERTTDLWDATRWKTDGAAGTNPMPAPAVVIPQLDGFWDVSIPDGPTGTAFFKDGQFFWELKTPGAAQATRSRGKYRTADGKLTLIHDDGPTQTGAVESADPKKFVWKLGAASMTFVRGR